MSKLTSFITISFSVLNNDEDLMSSKGNDAVAVIKGHESYKFLLLVLGMKSASSNSSDLT